MDDLEITIVPIAEGHSAVIRRSLAPAELGDFFKAALDKVSTLLQARGVEPIGPAFGLYHHFSEETVDVEAGLPVAEPVAPEGEVKPGRLPGGRAARVLHEGHYDRLPDTYAALSEWIEAAGHQFAGPPWEVYVIGPEDDSNPASWRAEVFWPIT